MSNGNRGASRPAAGALRVGVDVSIANIMVWLAAKVVPAEVLGDVENLIVIGIAAALGAVGKWLRNNDNVIGEII